MNLRGITVAVYLTTGVLLSFSISAHAITFSRTQGRLRPVTNPPTTEGSFSNYGVTTIDFNSGTVSNGNYNPSGTIASYSGITGVSSIRSGNYAPPRPGGATPANGTSDNTSNFLNVSQANPVTVNFSTPLYYFGLNWGFGDSSNTIDFFSVNSSGTASNQRTFNFANVFGTSPTESSAYVDFFAENASDTFNRVTLGNTSSTGFETDNHSYRTTPVPWEPFPTLDLLGLGALGGVIWLKRKRKKNSKLLNQVSVK